MNLRPRAPGKGADVYADGENLAEALVDSGMAVRYDGGKKNARWCE